MACIEPRSRGIAGLRRAAWRLAVLGLALGLALIAGCGEPEPLKVGFVGCLTGHLSDLGVSGRDAAILAVEDINRAGGVNGRPITLIIKDDRQQAPAALQADQELIEAGVVAIIGHMTSTMSLAVLDKINAAHMVMISPTTSTNLLTGKDDYFFRVMPPNITETEHLATHAYQRAGLHRAAVVYDSNNSAYSNGFYSNFRLAYHKLGGAIVLAKAFDSKQETDFSRLATELLAAKAQAVVIIASAVDAAMLRQQMHRMGADPPVFAAGWAMTEQFLQHGGRAVEGVMFSNLIDTNSQRKQWLDFKGRFMERFGYAPGFPAMHAYDAVMALRQALSQMGPGEDLRQALVRIKTYQGLQADFEIDRTGDASRPRFLIQVKDGRYEVVK